MTLIMNDFPSPPRFTLTLALHELDTLISSLEETEFTLRGVVRKFPEADPMLKNIQQLKVRFQAIARSERSTR